MIITDKYLRKLIWGVGFALFCALIAGMYAWMLRRKSRIIVRIKQKTYTIFSPADFIAFFIMTLVAGIRLNVGSDYYNYYIRFNAVKKTMSITKDILPKIDGYWGLSYVIKQFTDNEYAIFGVIAIILYGYLFHLIKENGVEKSTALICYLFLGFFANSLNILKQCIAMMFVLCFYKKLCNKKNVLAIIFAIFAFFFHYSAIFAIVIITIFTKIKLPPNKILLISSIILGVGFALTLPQLITLLIKLVPSASGYKVYINWRRNGQIRLIIAVIGMSLMYIFLLFQIVKNRTLIKKISEQRYWEISFLIIGLCINIASIRIWVVQRVALYFYQFVILILPTMFHGMEPEQRKKSKQLLFLIMFIYLIFSGVFFGENEYYSYNTIFSDDLPMYDADFNRMFN